MKKYIYGFMSLALLSTLAVAVPVLADNTNSPNQEPGTAWGRGMMGRDGAPGMGRFGVFGTVSAISGNKITVVGKQGPSTNVVTTTYTVDATNAKIYKTGAAGTISSIVVGDTVMVQGTATGTNITATIIRDGYFGGKALDGKNRPVSPITGNGQPVIAGKITAISGSTITITNQSNVTYTVDASNAKIAQGPNTITISGLSVGDAVVVQGTINGNAVVASSVIDQVHINNANVDENNGKHLGFFGGIGAFFSHLFGF